MRDDTIARRKETCSDEGISRIAPYLAIADERSVFQPWNRSATLACLKVENLRCASLPDRQSAEASLRPRSNVFGSSLAIFRISVVHFSCTILFLHPSYTPCAHRIPLPFVQSLLCYTIYRGQKIGLMRG